MINIRIQTCLVFLLFTFVLTTGTAFAETEDLTPIEQLGKDLYFDTSLSTPDGQSCATCHDPDAGFADPESDLPVSDGIIPNRFGNRNSPSAAYAAFSPEFVYDDTEGLYIGGQFWDGRATNLSEQAKGPFLNPLEMNNPNKLAVILDVRKSEYAEDFTKVYGMGSLDDVDAAYEKVALAIAAYESSTEVNSFSSKYDAYLADEVQLTKEERKGLKLFEGKGNCASCHPSTDPEPLFTDYTYDNLGVPKNPDNPFYSLPVVFNPLGDDFVDYGLGAALEASSEGGSLYPDEMGKVKVPTLRNIAETGPYMHNGVFEDLTEVVDFYNTRDVGDWPEPEVPQNVNKDELGDLGLNDREVEYIVAFMETLSDGYDPESD